jgi:H+-translocating NAD(P) transhydrogenase subunit beta
MSFLVITRLSYLMASVLFILGLKRMSQPRTAVGGNRLGAVGMAVAMVTAWVDPAIGGHRLIVMGIGLGSVIGYLMAKRVQMTSMPQMVGLLNGLGGAASVLVGSGELWRAEHLSVDGLLAIAASGLIGAVTFTGSLVAVGKLEEIKFFDERLCVPQQRWVNLFLGLLAALIVTWLVQHGGGFGIYLLLVFVSSGLGVLLVSGIGGADMPVVIALMNSYSGLAAASTGFVIGNDVLIIAGALVGASGVILTQIMCRAMNRSWFNVLFGGMGMSKDPVQAGDVYATVRKTSPEDVAMILDGVHRVVVIPGYGMAVAQAQHAVHDLTAALTKKQVEVRYAIHPVAGRMPGHMNVLLAEADVPYEQLAEMDEINAIMDTVDVAIVLGANDVVNPVARTDPRSPIAGMPIIDADKAKVVIVIKRSLSPGFAGIPNPLFALPNALVLFADGKQAVLDILEAMRKQ